MTTKVKVSAKDIYDDFIKLFEESEPKVEKIKYKVIGTSLTTIIDGKTIVKKSTKEEIEAIKVDIEKYNKLEGKPITGISEKLKAKVTTFVQSEAIKEQTEKENKISKLKVDKKVLKKNLSTQPVDKVNNKDAEQDAKKVEEAKKVTDKIEVPNTTVGGNSNYGRERYR